MKKTFTLILVIISFIIPQLYAQSVDLEVEIISTSGSIIPCDGSNFEVVFKVQNNGPNAMSAGDELWIQTPEVSSEEVYIYTLTSTLNAGESVIITSSFPYSDFITLIDIEDMEYQTAPFASGMIYGYHILVFHSMLSTYSDPDEENNWDLAEVYWCTDDCIYELITTPTPSEWGTVTGGGVYDCEEEFTVTATPNPGYIFQGWYMLDEGYEYFITDEMIFTADVEEAVTIELLARFQPEGYVCEYEVVASTSPSEAGTVIGSGLYSCGEEFTVTAVPNPDYYFNAWIQHVGGYSYLVSIDEVYTSVVESPENVYLEAQFIYVDPDCEYEIIATATPPGTGTATGSGVYSCGETFVLTATPEPDYVFQGWYQIFEGEEYFVSSDPIIADFMEEPVTIEVEARFQPVGYVCEYEIVASASPSEGGTITGAGTYECEEMFTITATPNPGYIFAGWYESFAGEMYFITGDPSFSALIEDPVTATLVAYFTPSASTFTINTSSSPSIGGSTSGAGSYDIGTSATVTATPAAGYTFLNWKEGSTVVSTSSSYTFTVTGNRNLVAHFETSGAADEFTVTTSSIPSLGGTTSGAGTYTSGTTVNLLASPAEGYEFVNWTEAGIMVATTNSYSFSITGNRNLTANFIESTHIDPSENIGNNIEVFPIPFEDKININVQNLKLEEVLLIDNLGRIIKYEKTNNPSTISIHTEDISAGFYILKIITDKGSKEYKIVK